MSTELLDPPHTSRRKSTDPALSGDLLAIPAVRFPVGVGQMVILYNSATRSADQIPAVVECRTGRDQIDVLVLRHGTSNRVQYVRHVDDEFFEKNPDKVNKQPAWDYVEAFYPQEAEQQASEFGDDELKLFGGEAGEKMGRRIVELQIAGKSPKQIVHIMGQKGLTLKRVQSFLALHNAR